MRKVVITGAGIVSTLGDSASSVHQALCEGRSGLQIVENADGESKDYRLSGEVRDFDAQNYLGNRNLRPLNRAAQFTASAAQLALDDSDWDEEMRQKFELGLVLGTMFCSVQTITDFDHRALVAGPSCASPMDFANTVINAAAGQTSILHNLRGINSTISTGASSGLRAIGYAAEWIRTGKADALLAGGVEEFSAVALYAFQQAGLLCGYHSDQENFPKPFNSSHNGIVLGEGAALLMLEEAESAEKRGATVLAEIKGCGDGFDFTNGSDEEKSVAAIAKAMREALESANTNPSEIDCLSASANGICVRDRYEVSAITSVYNGYSESLPVTAIKSMLGETLGAAGAIQVVDMVETIRDGFLPGIVNFDPVESEPALKNLSAEKRRFDIGNAQINSLGIEGNHCSLVVGRY